MNELYAADPLACNTASDLALLLKSFGPYAGRYLATYPSNWISQIESQFDTAGEIENARVKTLLRRAKESMTLVAPILPWHEEKEWIVNASAFLAQTETRSVFFNALIAAEAKPPSVHLLHELDLPPTADELIFATVREYARITKMLLLYSSEIALIDPYLDPRSRNYAPVLKALLESAPKGKCKRILLWARESALIKTNSPAIERNDIESALRELARHANLKHGSSVEMFLVADERQQTKMHGRYLLSIKGGIRLDQGFQKLPEGRRVDVGPIGKTTHDEQLGIYFEDKHDMQIVHHIAFDIG